ncbi:3-ketoacyl-CoA synthase 20-like [Mercurialis annua]|uniref:3-ketoacyl-CoA synthase 20-like n=1 Tax=Mercurialis annua TaxID=3986 RepID=UPI00216068B8|nr:3-ketoacyl-CoA synthase 20-like [Mercurialis annua]
MENQKTLATNKPISADEANKEKINIKLQYVKLGYHYLVSNGILIPFLALILVHLSTFTVEDVSNIWNHLKLINFITLFLCSSSIIFAVTLYFMSKPRKIYLVDYSCYKPKPNRKVTREQFLQLSAACGCFSDKSMILQRKILEKSGFGQMTYGPKGLMEIPQNQSMAESRSETEMLILGAIDGVLLKTGVNPSDIGILVVNSSLFNPAPSLSAVIVNHYKLRCNILSYNLGGMGCSAGLISIDLAKDLLQVHPNSYALVVSTENITRNWYMGNEPSMLVTNCLFRIGAAAILLSNRSSDRQRSKYQLIHTVRTHKGADDNSYACITQREDDNQVVGVSLSKDLMVVAGEALKSNITTLGPLVLPVSEQLLFFATLLLRKIFKMKIKPYVPDFKLAFEHFCIHAGGRGVLDEVEKNLALTPWLMEPSRMTLYRFGNTSSSSLWYELSYSEAKRRVKKGDRVWQIGFGSGFKCNSAVWHALRTINPDKDNNNPWIDEINEFPAHIPKFTPIVY